MAMSASLLDPVIAPVITALVTHLVVHRTPPESIPAFLLTIFLAPIALTVALANDSHVFFFVRTLAIYLVALSTSIVAYRLSPLHPLAKYPGPVLARVSRLWAARQVMKKKQHIVSHELFEMYKSDVVRTGPDHLIIRDPKAIPVVLGPKNMWPKHGRYAMAKPYETSGSLLSIIDPAEHGKRRRVWERAFTPVAVKSYDPMLHARTGQLVSELELRIGQPLDIADWFGFFTFDFMGDFAFAGAFNSMKNAKDVDGFHDLIIKGLGAGETFGTMPWLRPIILAIPGLGISKLFSMALNAARTRQESSSQIRDLFFYLLGEEEGATLHPPMNTATLATEAGLAIIAGSDTTSVALSNMIFYLIQHPHHFARLRAEVDAAAGEDSTVYDVDVDSDQLVGLKFLQAVINETIRLQPAVPNGVQRTPPKEGGPVVVAGHVVPVGATVQIPTWSLHRDGRHFSPDPSEFMPERWLPEEGAKVAQACGQEYRLNQAAYMPFNYGPGNCVGRSLALHEMRTVLSALVRRFDFQFAPGFQLEDWKAQLNDQYILTRGQLPVVLSKRL